MTQLTGPEEVDARVPLTTIQDLVDVCDPAKLAKLEARLSDLSPGQLVMALRRSQQDERRVGAWYVNREFTKRHIPPVFRPGLARGVSNESLMDGLAYDLDWLAQAYPSHVVQYGRWDGYADPDRFHKAVRYIFNGTRHGARIGGLGVKGFALTLDQQREMHYLRTPATAALHAALIEKSEVVRIELTSAYMRRQHDRTGKTVVMGDLDRRIISRRLNVWRCAQLADWSQTRTARLFNGMVSALDSSPSVDTKNISRQLAGNLMDDLRRDLPTRMVKRRRRL